MNKNGISIIIPCYQAGNLLSQAIESIQLQKFCYYNEIIIVDDGSNDKTTQENLKNLYNLPNIQIIKLTKNLGAQNARNTGIKAANYNFILMMDADDTLSTDPNIIKAGTYANRAINILNSDSNIAFVHCMSMRFGNTTGLRNTYQLTESLIMAKHRVPIWIIYRKSDLTYSQPYHNSIKKWQDWSFAVGLLNHRMSQNKENNICFLPSPYYNYRIHQITQRVSAQYICEKTMIHATYSLYPEIFQYYYPKKTKNQTVAILINKSQNLRTFIQEACIMCDDKLKCHPNLDFP